MIRTDIILIPVEKMPYTISSIHFRNMSIPCLTASVNQQPLYLRFRSDIRLQVGFLTQLGTGQIQRLNSKPCDITQNTAQLNGTRKPEYQFDGRQHGIIGSSVRLLRYGKPCSQQLIGKGSDLRRSFFPVNDTRLEYCAHTELQHFFDM